MDLFNIIECLNAAVKDFRYTLHKVSKPAPFSPAYTLFEYTLYERTSEVIVQKLSVKMTLKTVTTTEISNGTQIVEKEFLKQLFTLISNGK